MPSEICSRVRFRHLEAANVSCGIKKRRRGFPLRPGRTCGFVSASEEAIQRGFPIRGPVRDVSGSCALEGTSRMTQPARHGLESPRLEPLPLTPDGL